MVRGTTFRQRLAALIALKCAEVADMWDVRRLIAAVLLVGLLAIGGAGSAAAADRHLFEFEHECRSTLSEYRNNPGLRSWAVNADCNWHPELGPRGMWYLY